MDGGETASPHTDAEAVAGVELERPSLGIHGGSGSEFTPETG